MIREHLSTLGTVLGAAVAVYSMWFIMRGPFFGRPMPPLKFIMLAVGTFIVGIIAFAWGLNAAVEGGDGERVDLEENQQRTYK